MNSIRESSDSSETLRGIESVVLGPAQKITKVDHSLRLCCLGDLTSGKRELLQSIAQQGNKNLRKSDDAVLERISGICWLVLHLNVNGLLVRVQAFDSTGRDGRVAQGKSPFSPGAFAGMDIVFVVYDCGVQESFEYAVMWLELLAFTGFSKTVVLVGNKWEKTLIGGAVVTQEQGLNTAKNFSTFFTEASSELDLQRYAVASLDISIRYALLSVARKESLVDGTFSTFPLLSGVSLNSEASERLRQAALEDARSRSALVVPNFSGGGKALSSSSSSMSQSASPKKPSKTSPFKGSRRALPALLDAIQRRDVPSVLSTLADASSSLSSARQLERRDPITKASALIVCALCATGHGDDLKIAEALIGAAVGSSSSSSSSSSILDAQTVSGDTALHTLVSNPAAGSMMDKVTLPFLRLLLGSKVNIHLQNVRGNTVFHLACEKNLFRVLEELLRANGGRGCAVPNTEGETPLYICCRQGATESLNALLSCSDEETPQSVHIAAGAGRSKYFPLHAAVLGRHPGCVELLVSRVGRVDGGGINALNGEGYTPLYLALELNDAVSRNALIRMGADPRVGKPHRLCSVASFFHEVFVPAHLEWLSSVSKQQTCVADLSRCHLEHVPPVIFQWTWLRTLDLSGCMIETLPRHVGDLIKLEHLFLQDNRLRSIPNELANLTNLVTLRLDGNMRISPDLGPVLLNLAAHRRGEPAVQLDVADLGLVECCELMQSCTTLEDVALNLNDLRTVPPQLGPTVKALWMQQNKIDALSPDLRVLAGPLELLKLSDNHLSSVAALSGCHSLRELWLEHNRFTQFPIELSGATALSRLWLDNNTISTIPSQISKFASLSSLSLTGNRLTELPAEISRLTNLKRLWLDNNSLQRLNDAMSALSQLELLSLSGNALSAVPPIVSRLPSLKELYLNHCMVEEVDPSIGNLVGLRKLGLSHNSLKFLPQTVGHLTALTYLDLQGNPNLTSPPPETVKNGPKAILGFMRDLLAESKLSYRMKLMVVGQEAVGKTTLLATLLGKRKPTKRIGASKALSGAGGGAPLSTDGIDIEQWERKMKPNPTADPVKVRFKAWDFAGQEVYYSTHGFFLSNRSIYLVVWSMMRDEEQQRVSFWLQSIQSRARKAPVLLIGTHAETMDAGFLAQYEQRVLERFRGAFPNLSIMSFTPVSSTTGLNMKLLLERLDAAAIAQPFMGEPLPVSYLHLEAAVERERKRVPPVMSWQEFRQLGAGCNIVREDELTRAVSLLHDMGSLLCFLPSKKQQQQQQDYDQLFVVLDPQWLTKMMAQIITTKKSFVQNAILDHCKIPLMWKAPEYPDHLHPHLMKLLQSFDISFRMDDEVDFYRGRSLIPVTLGAHVNARSLLQPPDDKQIWVAQLGRIFLFDFIPAGFFARLVVRLMALCKFDGIWADVACFRHEDATAVILVSHAEIEVRVRATSNSVASTSAMLALLKMVVLSLEALCEGWFEIQTDTKIPCAHCLLSRVPKQSAHPHLFTLSECEEAAAQSLQYVSCGVGEFRGEFQVSLQALCPDVTISSELPLFHWDALEDQVRIGEGTFAYVYRATLQGHKVAVKRLINESDFRELRKEAASLLSLRHHNIVGIVGVCLKPIALITEFLSRGSLFDVLQDASVELTWSRRVTIVEDVARGMNFLHTTTPPVLHRDLKSANVLLTDGLEAKISDFGTTVVQGAFTAGRSVTNPRWQAPEVLLDQEYASPSDVYAFAIVMWEVATRLVPFSDKQAYNWAHNVEDDVCRGVRPPIPEGIPRGYSNMMVACWQQAPKDRPSFDEVLRKFWQGLDVTDLIMDLRHAKK